MLPGRTASRVDALALLVLVLFIHGLLSGRAERANIPPFDARVVGMGVMQPVDRQPVELPWSIHLASPTGASVDHPHVWSAAEAVGHAPQGVLWERRGQHGLLRTPDGRLLLDRLGP